MKYYSDKTKKFYETEEECEKDEEIFDSYKRRNSNLKKQLAKKVEDSDKELNDAYDKYKIAKDEASKILKEAEERANAVVNDARAEVVKAQKNKEDTLRNFNEKFGNYTVTYTGEDAVKEFKRAFDWIDNFFNFRLI